MSPQHADQADDIQAGTLAEHLLSARQFDPFVDDCTTLVAAQVKRRGISMRTALSVVQKVKPNILERTVREQMPDFIRELEPLYAAYGQADPAGFAAYLGERDAQVADAVLHVADRRAERIHSRTIRSAYQRVRGRAQREVVSVVPELAAIIQRHLRLSQTAEQGATSA